MEKGSFAKCEPRNLNPDFKVHWESLSTANGQKKRLQPRSSESVLISLLTASLDTSPLFWVFCILLIPVFHFNFHQRRLYWWSVYTSAIFYLFRLLRWQHSLLKPVYLTFIYLNAAINCLQLLISGNVKAKSKFSDHYPRFKCNYSMSVQYLTSN